jgi:hypothetical protein
LQEVLAKSLSMIGPPAAGVEAAIPGSEGLSTALEDPGATALGLAVLFDDRSTSDRATRHAKTNT